MTDNELSMEERIAGLSRIMNTAHPTFNEATVNLCRFFGRDVMETPDNDVCDIVDAVDGMPLSESEYHDCPINTAWNME